VDKIGRYVQQDADRRTSILSKFIERGLILVRPSTNELVHDARFRAQTWKTGITLWKTSTRLLEACLRGQAGNDGRRHVMCKENWKSIVHKKLSMKYRIILR